MKKDTPETALITGSYGGLGRCFAALHAARGGSLILVGRSEEKLAAQKSELAGKYHADIQTIACDLSQPGAAAHIHDTCREHGWTVDVLINNAGFGGRGDFARERSMEDDLAMIAVNIETPTRLLKLFLPDMIARGAGRVLNVSSTAASMPGPLQAVYFATKAYLTSLGNALARELADTGVTVTTLMPGAMKTGFIARGDLARSKMFQNAIDPMDVARDGYEGMRAGKLNVVSGLVSWQKPFVSLAPLLPKKAMLDFVYDQHQDQAR